MRRRSRIRGVFKTAVCQFLIWLIASGPVHADTLMLWRRPIGTWYGKVIGGGAPAQMTPFLSGGYKQWGLPSDVPFYADVDGDGRGDLIVYRPSEFKWYIAYSSFPGTIVVPFGYANGKPCIADFDGDGKMDLAFLVSGQFQIRESSTLRIVTRHAPIGGEVPSTTLVPLPAAYERRGRAQAATYRTTMNSQGRISTWQIAIETNDIRNPITVGQAEPALDVPCVGDRDGNGTTDLIRFRTSTGEWFIHRFEDIKGHSLNSTRVAWGLPNDIPVPYDYDSDGRVDLAVFRPSTGYWYILTSSGQPLPGFTPHFGGWAFQWGGLSGDVPLARIR